jgi:hypothetical protein
MGKQKSGDFARDLNEQGQSCTVSDNQGDDSQPAMDKSEGQLLEDTKVGRPMLTSTFISLKGRTISVSTNDDDPLVCLKAVDQLRRERSLRPNHEDASQVDTSDHFEFERPYFGPIQDEELKPGNLVSSHWRKQSRIPQVELPTELRKSVLKQRIVEAERSLLPDPTFFCTAWTIRHIPLGTQRDQAMKKFWKEVYQERSHNDRRAFMEFALNDLLEAGDELYRLEHPMMPSAWSWGPLWRRRTSADTVRSSSLGRSMVGTGSVHPSRSHPVNTVGFSN